ncbi:MAG: hypothetical protein ACFFFH_10895 [Candidatus Thorarchaeota archaeon]
MKNDRYREYDQYKLEWSVEFTEGGTLVKASQTKNLFTNKLSIEYSRFIQNKAISLDAVGGSLIPEVTHTFALPNIILAVISSTIILRFVRKRRN